MRTGESEFWSYCLGCIPGQALRVHIEICLDQSSGGRWHVEKDLGETIIKVITHTWEIGELASVKRKLWIVKKIPGKRRAGRNTFT